MYIRIRDRRAKKMDSIREIYSNMIRAYGPHARGVGWAESSTQRERFFRLLKYESMSDRHIIDVGCGYGALIDYVIDQRPKSYLGIDENGLMIDKLRELHSRKGWVKVTEGDIFEEDFEFQPNLPVDENDFAIIASGLLTYASMSDLEIFLENVNPYAGYVAFNFFTEKAKLKNTFEEGEKVFSIKEVVSCCMDNIDEIVGIKTNVYMNGTECAVRIKTYDW